MKKVLHINLGGKEFTINEDAFAHLENYLNAIEKHFSNTQGFEGILYDIEVRIGELFEEDAKNGSIINMKKLDRVINTMGKPEDFSDEDETLQSTKSDRAKIVTGKKLFRDPDDKILGGVASGLSAYFGIQDPIIIRIAFVLLFVIGGTGFLAYLILWIAIPKARSTSDFLAMKGEEINIDNIAKSVQNSLKDIKDKLDDFSKGFKTKIL